MSAGGVSSTMFSGNSRYANDFRSVIDRSVAIASLPLNLLQSQKTALQDQSGALNALDSKLSGLQSAIANLDSATGSSSYSASVSDSTIASASAGAGIVAGSYTLEVTKLGSYNNTMSVDGLDRVKNPAGESLSACTNFTLSAGGKTFSFSAANLNEMVAKINSSGLSVQASAVNVGPPDAPDYRLSIQGARLGKLDISLTDDATPDPNELLSTLSEGEKAAYKVNGFATAATTDSRTVEIAPGLTVNLLKQSQPGEAVTIAVTRPADSAKNALASFVNAYNAATGEVDKSRGVSKSPLAGQSIVYAIDHVLAGLQAYSPGSGPFSSLEDLGISLDRDGKLSFDAAAFDKAVNGNVAGLMSFLGGASTGGFVKAATEALSALEDPDDGTIHSAIDLMNSQIARQDQRISEEQDRIDDLRLNLEHQMAAADALIAQLEQQAGYINSMFQSMQAASETYK